MPDAENAAPESGAETLRRAAALMRKRAEDSTPSPWRVVADPDGVEVSVIGGPRDHYLADVHEWSTGLGNPFHIASWHPAVALAVADMLDRAADEWEAEPGTCASYYGAAIDAARAYLGGSHER